MIHVSMGLELPDDVTREQFRAAVNVMIRELLGPVELGRRVSAQWDCEEWDRNDALAESATLRG